jgi:hypothetical protein
MQVKLAYISKKKKSYVTLQDSRIATAGGKIPSLSAQFF